MQDSLPQEETCVGGVVQDFALQEAMLDKLGVSLMRPGALDNMKSIDYAHLFWACGLMHINPCNGAMLEMLAQAITRSRCDFSLQACRASPAAGLC